ncbi:MAG: hypothetical protein VW397_01070, partial [Candidatus Margulisiibacteriota bacterium]
KQTHQNKLDIYQKCKNNCYLKNIILEQKLARLATHNRKNPIPLENLRSYLQLNTASIFGVPYWSSFLTKRYLFNEHLPLNLRHHLKDLFKDASQFYTGVNVQLKPFQGL